MKPRYDKWNKVIIENLCVKFTFNYCAIHKSNFRLGSSITVVFSELFCLHLDDPDSDWYLRLITATGNQMMKFGLSLQFLHQFVFILSTIIQNGG